MTQSQHYSKIGYNVCERKVCMKKCMEYEVEDSRPRGRRKRTWIEVVQDSQAHKLSRDDAMDCGR